MLHVPGAGRAVLIVHQMLTTPPLPYALATFMFLLIVFADPGKDSKRRDEEAPDVVADEDRPAQPVGPH